MPDGFALARRLGVCPHQSIYAVNGLLTCMDSGGCGKTWNTETEWHNDTEEMMSIWNSANFNQ